MNPRSTAESSEPAIEQNAALHTATSNFSLPFRIPAQPARIDVSGPSDIHSTLGQNSGKIKDSFTTLVVNKYSGDCLGSTVWQYKICGQKAKDLFHAAISTLSALGSATSDALISVCKSEKCVTYGHASAESLAKNASSSSETTTCENCSSKSKLKLYAACRFTSVAQRSTSVGVGGGQSRRRRRSNGEENTGASGSGTRT